MDPFSEVFVAARQTISPDFGDGNRHIIKITIFPRYTVTFAVSKGRKETNPLSILVGLLSPL